MIALIAARGGSKRLPNKNTKLFNGKPLIYWTILAAQKSKLFEKIIVSTDDADIAEICKSYGAIVPFLRPAPLATDKAEMLHVVLHAIDFLNFSGNVTLLQPTSPLRRERHILEVFELFKKTGRHVVSFMEVAQSLNWLYYQDGQSKNLLKVKDKYEYGQISIEGEENTILIPNGAIYMFETTRLKNSGKFIDKETEPYLMNKEDSSDIDTKADGDFADIVFKGKNHYG